MNEGEFPTGGENSARYLFETVYKSNISEISLTDFIKKINYSNFEFIFTNAEAVKIKTYDKQSSYEIYTSTSYTRTVFS